MAVRSHIQIPKGVLKQFSEASGRVYYLEVNTCKIGLTSAKKLGTEYGYYSEEQEKYLNKEIESPLILLAATVREFLEQKRQTLTLSVSAEESLKKYITGAMARSELSLDAFLSASFTAAFFTPQQNHDQLVYFSTKKNGGVTEIIKDHFLVLLINKTERNFVVPRNCFYVSSSHGCECIIAPISPKCALCLFPPEYVDKIDVSKKYRLCYVENSADINKMNHRALMYEYMYNKKFVASATREELEELAAFTIERKQELEELWAKVHKK